MGSDFMKWTGISEVDKAFTRVMADVDAAARDMVAEGAALVEARAKANFQGSHKKGAPHVGGMQPNVVSGSLRRSIRSDAIRRDGIASASTVVAPRLIYGRRVELEYGYAFFGPSVTSSAPMLKAIAFKHWQRAISHR